MATLSSGVHILYAYATDGQDATSIQAGGGASEQSSPLIGNITAYVFLVTPLTAAVDELQDHVHSLGLHQGLDRSLTAKLLAVRRSLESGHTSAACGQLGAFINQVRAHSSHKIPAADAGDLIDEATVIRNIVGCK